MKSILDLGRHGELPGHILDLGKHGELPGHILDLGRHGELPGHAIMERGLTGGTEHLLGDED